MEPRYDRYTFSSEDDVLDAIETCIDCNVIGRMYEHILPRNLLIPKTTDYLRQNVKGRIKGQEQQNILNDEILQQNMYLSKGQSIFHAGTTILPDEIIEPLSTSLSPAIAYSNAFSYGKANIAGRLVFHHLIIEESPPVYVYPEGESHELEVIFSSGFCIAEKELYRTIDLPLYEGHNYEQTRTIPLEIYRGNIKSM